VLPRAAKRQKGRKKSIKRKTFKKLSKVRVDVHNTRYVRRRRDVVSRGKREQRRRKELEGRGQASESREGATQRELRVRAEVRGHRHDE
jgi:hypothetical protein